ncbi:NAD(P)/FAD-dependent oxidoreductase [Asticcacaulis tiandongensis]|uniref:NAD(P)/FAD-dependent oxidoreductase n=1 Tax=Asticcacaulis tiandongensis TaxID=2565365 RepID=UPI001127A415|nr:NAD(P)/FAD-dependent oxidoreductase [Asticcacaulis tiandongensis]
MFDAIVIGGSFASISAATYMARARLKVLVIDGGEPRNRFAAASHGFLTQDGSSPFDMLETAHAQLLAYPSVSFVTGYALRATQTPEGFAITVGNDSLYHARRLLLATGVRDILPDIDGFAERWGKSIGHCPYCHGYEINQAPIAVMSGSDMAAHYALLVSQWGPVTLLTNGAKTLPEDDLDRLRKANIVVETAPVSHLKGNAPDLSEVVLTDGKVIAASAMLAAVRFEAASDIAAQLGCTYDDSLNGPVLRVDDSGQTTVTGVYAAGDITHMRHSVALAVAGGMVAGTSLHQSLVFG